MSDNVSDNKTYDFNDSQEKLSIDRINNAKSRVAKVLNILETTSQEIKWACESQKWNEEVAYQIDDAATTLGYVLATLTRWFDPDESFKDE